MRNFNMYHNLAVAGTFDHFHKGHKYLLEQAIKQGEKLSVGITSETMVQGKILSSAIEPYETRVEQVVSFLKQHIQEDAFTVFKLEDIYGIAVDDSTLDAIFVTDDTFANAEKINKARAEKKLPELAILTSILETGEDGEVISSTRIRLGQIDRNGRSYLQPFTEKSLFTAPQLIREELRDPIGEVFAGSEADLQIAAQHTVNMLKTMQATMVITVGDIVTYSLQKEGFEPHISFIDNRSRRKDLENITHSAIHSHGSYKNEAGTIQSSIVQKYAEIVPDVAKTKDHHQIIVDGEEDLLGLAAIMLAPLESVVLYGQFGQGIVLVRIDEERKEYAYDLLKSFV